MLNNVNLQGRLTATPELKTTSNDKKFVSFRLAVGRIGKNAGADFISLIAWDSTAEFIAKHFEKSQQMLVEGHLHTRTVPDQNDNTKTRTVMEVVADQVHFCGNKPNGTANMADEVVDEPLDDEE